MEAYAIAFQLVLAYIGTHIVLIPVRIVNKLIKRSERIGYPVFIPVFLIVFVGFFLYRNRDIDFSYVHWGETISALLLLLVIAGVAGYIFALVIRGKGKKLSASVFEAGFFITLVVVVFSSIPPGLDTARGRVSEALALESAFKSHVAEFFSANQRYPNNSELKTFGLPMEGKYVHNLVINDKGRITATMKAGVYKGISGKHFIITPHDGGKTWDCGSPDLPDKYLPGVCRKN